LLLSPFRVGTRDDFGLSRKPEVELRWTAKAPANARKCGSVWASKRSPTNCHSESVNHGTRECRMRFKVRCARIGENDQPKGRRREPRTECGEVD